MPERRLLSSKATAWPDKPCSEIICLIFSILLGLVSGFDIVDVGIRLGSQEETRKVGSTLGLLPPVSVVVCTTPTIAQLMNDFG